MDQNFTLWPNEPTARNLKFRHGWAWRSELDARQFAARNSWDRGPSAFTPINPRGLGSNSCGAAFVVAGKIDLTEAANLK